jgi:Plavaka transposase
MVLCLSQSFLVATKQLFLSQQVTQNIGHCMPQLAIFTIMSGVRMVQGFPLSPFWLSRRVSVLIHSDLICTPDIHLAIKADANSVDFRQFRRKLFHVSLSTILESLRPGETTPEVFRCSDGHYRRVIWGLGPYIADYPEQALLACIVQNWCAKCALAFCCI